MDINQYCARLQNLIYILNAATVRVDQVDTFNRISTCVRELGFIMEDMKAEKQKEGVKTDERN